MFEVEKKKVVRNKFSRADRLDTKNKGTLLCEWCNMRTHVKPPQNYKKGKFRWSDVSLGEYRKFRKCYVMFTCDRTTCVQSRPEDIRTIVKEDPNTIFDNED